MTTTIKSCTCKHDWQDQKYGVGKRVMNQMVKEGVLGKYRCTVCGKDSGSTDKKKKK